MLRIAASGVSRKVSSSFRRAIGDEVGYHIGGEKHISGYTAIKFVTERILLNEIENDKSLSKYSVVLIDEAHERHVETDMLMGHLKQIIGDRKDLKVVIMSASIDVIKFANYFNTQSSKFFFA